MRARLLSAKLLAAGSIIPFDTTGIDFAMTALYAVPVVEQWKTHKNHIPDMVGFVTTVAAGIKLFIKT